MVAVGWPAASRWQAWPLAVSLTLAGLATAAGGARRLKALFAKRRAGLEAAVRDSLAPDLVLLAAAAATWFALAAAMTWLRLQTGGAVHHADGLITAVGELEPATAALTTNQRAAVVAALGLALDGAAAALAVLAAYRLPDRPPAGLTEGAVP
jgi:hypothetical protein